MRKIFYSSRDYKKYIKKISSDTYSSWLFIGFSCLCRFMKPLEKKFDLSKILPEKISEKVERKISKLQQYLRASLLPITTVLVMSPVYANDISQKKNPSAVSKETIAVMGIIINNLLTPEDTDHDGVKDPKDKCPNSTGQVDPNGCELVKIDLWENTTDANITIDPGETASLKYPTPVISAGQKYTVTETGPSSATEDGEYTLTTIVKDHNGKEVETKSVTYTVEVDTGRGQ